MYISRVFDFIKENRLIDKDENVILSVSGGPDSVVMLDIMNRLKDKLEIDLQIYHLNHMLRGKDAKEDEEFVKRIASEYDLKINLFRANIKKYALENNISVETAGRKIRYEQLKTLSNNIGSNSKIATAHILDDNSESIFMHLIRGAGLKGMRGITAKRDNIIRPILCMNKNDVYNYIKEYNLDYRVDKTNFSDDYKRNYIRLNIIPEIEKEFSVNLNSNLLRFSELMTEDYNYLNDVAKEKYNKIKKVNVSEIKLNVDEITKLHTSILNRIIFMAIEEITGNRTDFLYTHIENIKNLLNLQSGSKVDLPNNLIALKEFNYLCIREEKREVTEKTEIKIDFDKTIFLHGYELFFSIKEKNEIQNILTKNTKKIYLCYDKIKSNDCFMIRNRKNGDKIYFEKRKITKKLKDYLIEERVPKSKRDQLLFLTLNGKIIWLIGSNEPFNMKANESTKKVLEIKYKKRKELL